MNAPLLLVAALAIAGLASPAGTAAAPPTPSACAGASTLPAGAAAATPISVEPAAWSVAPLADVDGINNVGDFGSLGGDRAGLVVTSGWRTWFTRTLDGGDTWSQPRALTSASTEVNSADAAFTGSHVDVVSDQGTDVILYRHSADRGRTWAPAVRLNMGWYPRVARGPGGIVAIVAVSGGRFSVRVSTDGGVSFGPRRSVGRYGTDGCLGDPGLPAVAIAGDAIVVSHWRNEETLVTRRSTDRGLTWSPPKALTSSEQGWTNQLVAHGASVLAVYRSGFSMASRLSVDGGATWSPPTLIATISWAASAGWSGGGWQLVDTRGSLIRYRSSSDGRHWTSPVVLFNDPDLVPESLGAAVLRSATLVPFISNDWQLEQEQILLASR